jgi:hypothetical protein
VQVDWKRYARIAATICGITLAVTALGFLLSAGWDYLFAVHEVEYVWQTHVSADGGFSVDLPGGPPEIDRDHSHVTVEQLRLADRTVIDITYSSRLESGVEAELDRQVRGYSTIPSLDILSSERATVGGLPGHAVKSECSRFGRAYVEYFRICVADRLVYYVRWMHLKSHDDPEFCKHVDRFFDSFGPTQQNSTAIASQSDASTRASQSAGNSEPTRQDHAQQRSRADEGKRRMAYALIYVFENNRRRLREQIVEARRKGRTREHEVEWAQETLQEYEATYDEKLERATGMTKHELIQVKQEGDRKGWPARK